MKSLPQPISENGENDHFDVPNTKNMISAIHPDQAHEQEIKIVEEVQSF